MKKITNLTINQSSTENLSVDLIDRLALLFSTELSSTAVQFILDLIDTNDYTDLRDCVADDAIISLVGTINTPSGIAYEDALNVLLTHGVSNSCADKYIRVYTAILNILLTVDGATDGKGISHTIADTLEELNLSKKDLDEFQTIHDIYNALTIINLEETNVSGEIDIDKYTNLDTIKTKLSKITNINGLKDKQSLDTVGYNYPDTISINNCSLSLNNITQPTTCTLSSANIDIIANEMCGIKISKDSLTEADDYAGIHGYTTITASNYAYTDAIQALAEKGITVNASKQYVRDFIEITLEGFEMSNWEIPKDSEGNVIYTTKTQLLEEAELSDSELEKLNTILGDGPKHLFPAVDDISYSTLTLSDSTNFQWVTLDAEKVKALAEAGLLNKLFPGVTNNKWISCADNTIAVFTTDDNEILSTEEDMTNKSRILCNLDSENTQIGEIDNTGVTSVNKLDLDFAVCTVGAYVVSTDLTSIYGIAGIFNGINGGISNWMIIINQNYDIPLNNLIKAHNIDPEISNSFNGVNRWLNNLGTAYINLNSILDTNSKIEIKFKYNSIVGNATMLGASGGGFELINYNDHFNYCYSGTWKESSYTVSKDVEYLIIVDFTSGNLYMSVNGTKILSSNTTSSTISTWKSYLFKSNRNGTPYISNASILYLRTIDSYGVKHYYIPCIKNTIVGLIDLMDLTFYASENSSTFIIND